MTRNLILFTFGQFGIMLLTRYLFQWLYSFGAAIDTATGTILLSSAALGTVFFTFRVFDAVTDPLAGWSTVAWLNFGFDKRSLLKLVSVLAPLGLVICFSPSFAMGTSVRWCIVTLGMALFFIGYTFYAIPFWSLLDELEETHPDKRVQFSNALGLGLLLATAVGFIVVPPLVHKVGYFLSALVVALVAFCSMSLPQRMKLKQSNERSALDKAIHWKDSARVAADLQFSALLCLLAGAQMTFTTITAATSFFALYLLKGSESDVSFLLGPLLAVALLCLAITPRLAQVLGSLRVVKFGSAYLCLVCALIYFIGFPESVSLWWTASCFCLAGPALALLLGLEGDLISHAAKETGKPLSLYFGFYNFSIKFFNGVAFAVTGFLIAQFSVSKDPADLLACIQFAAATPLLGVLMYYLLSWLSSKPTRSSTKHAA